MTVRITVTCDGTFDAGRFPCRGAVSFTVDQVADAAGLIGTDVVDVDAALELAHAAGWSCTDTGNLCPSHAGAQARALEAALEAYPPLTPASVRASFAALGNVDEALEQQRANR